MVLDERSRHHPYLRLEESLGAEAAATLMEHLPPVGWADVATKRDVDAVAVLMKRDLDTFRLLLDGFDRQTEQRMDGFEQRIDQRLDGVEERLELRFDSMENTLLATFRGELQTALTAQGRQLAITLAGTAGTLSALAFAAARLT